MNKIEMSFIGTCLVMPEFISKFEIKFSHFTNNDLSLIWKMMVSGEFDGASIVTKLGNRFENVLSDCVCNSCVSAIDKNAESIVQSYYKRLALLELTLAHKKVEGGADIASVLSELTKLTFSDEDSGFKPICSIAADAYKELEAGDTKKFMKTGYSGFDFFLGGLERKSLCIIAARPSMGKTALALGISERMSREYYISVSSLEMDSVSLAHRLMSSASNLDLRLLRTGKIKSLEAWRKMSNGISKIVEYKLSVDDTPNRKASNIAMQCRKQKAMHGLDVVIIDYIGLIRPEDTRLRKNEQIGAIMKIFKSLSKELDCAVVLLSQLNREAEGQIPNMSHLRDSGDIEQDADVVLFPRRFEEGGRECAEIIIGKNRNGPTGTISMNWNGETASYTDKPNIDI